MLSPTLSPSNPPDYYQLSLQSLSEDSDDSSPFRYYPLLLFVIVMLFVIAESTKPNPYDEHRRLIRHHLRNQRRQRRNPPPPPQPQPAPPPTASDAGSKVEKYASSNGGGQECAICLEEFRLGEECQMFLKCNHGFHKDCIDRWLAFDCHCPLCRGTVRGVPITNVDQV